MPIGAPRAATRARFADAPRTARPRPGSGDGRETCPSGLRTHFVFIAGLQRDAASVEGTMTVLHSSRAMPLSRRICAICHQPILPTEAVAALATEETSKSLVHVSCLVMDLPR